MGKLMPKERWQRYLMERYEAFKLSGELNKLRKEGLTILRLKKLYPSTDEWNSNFRERAYSQEYRAWRQKCEEVGKRFGLSDSVIVFACLLKGYNPQKMPFSMESKFPYIRIVTESTNSSFLANLAWEAQRFDLNVVHKRENTEIVLVVPGVIQRREDNGALEVVPAEKLPSLTPSDRPPFHAAFYIRVETPLEYPPELARELQKRASQVERELLRRLGYPARQRLRTSPLVGLAQDLKVGKPLTAVDGYDIQDKLYGEDDRGHDQNNRKSINSRRHKLKNRLVDPYKEP